MYTEVFAIIDPSQNFCHTIESEEFIFGVTEPALNTNFLAFKAVYYEYKNV